MRKIFALIMVVALFVSCKNNGWTTAQRNDFVTTCTNAATQAMGADKAKSYCSCMAQKLEVKYPNYGEANKALTQPGIMQTAEMTTIVQGCLGINGNNNNNIFNPPNPNGNNNNNNRMGGTWTNDDEQKFLTTCVQNAMNAGADQQTANAHCQCTLKKIEQKYTSYNDANQRMTKDEVTVMEQECNNNGNGNINNNNIDNNNNNRMGGGWTTDQHQQFVQSCAVSAQQQQGMTSQEANAYCECMTNKLEQKFTFDQASHLTAADFQTPEWQQAKMDCGAKRQ